MRPDISIIIVNYNSGELLKNCLSSIRDNLSINYEVIVTDNGSSDDSVGLCSEFFDGGGATVSSGRFMLLETGANLGFAKANNLAAGAASGMILHFLNPDTEIPASMNDDYAAVMAAPEAVYVNPLVNRDGSIENDRMPVPDIGNLIRWDCRLKNIKYWYRGASVIISADNFRKIGGWCEEYFLYAEDLDLFYVIQKNEIRISVLPSKIFHLGGGCSANTMSSLKREIQVQKSTRIFFRRHCPHGYTLSKLYLLLHTIIHRPGTLSLYLKAWFKSR